MIQFKDIPAHIRYPGMILAFLGMSVVGQMVVLNRALDGDGLQVEEDYYNKAVTWDAQRNARLQWTAKMGEVKLVPVKQVKGPTRVLVQITKMPDSPVQATKATGWRPAIAKPLHDVKITPQPKHSIQWMFDIPASAHGVWDYEISWKHEQGSFTTRHRIKL